MGLLRPSPNLYLGYKLVWNDMYKKMFNSFKGPCTRLCAIYVSSRGDPPQGKNCAQSLVQGPFQRTPQVYKHTPVLFFVGCFFCIDFNAKLYLFTHILLGHRFDVATDETTDTTNWTITRTHSAITRHCVNLHSTGVTRSILWPMSGQHSFACSSRLLWVYHLLIFCDGAVFQNKCNQIPSSA